MAMARYKLPKIPGLYQSALEIKQRYPIGTDLVTIYGERCIKSLEKSKDRRRVCDQDIAMAMLTYGRDMINKRPWMVMNKEALAFDAYYKTVLFGTASQINYIIRKLKVIYYLVDDTIEVNELSQPNSGTPQGRFIKRQRIPLPGGDQDTGPYYKITDIVVGDTVTFYGKEMKIIGVDNFTRDFLHKMGIDVADNESVPDDPYFVYRTENQLDVAQKNKAVSAHKNVSRDLDALILKFRGYWDGRYEPDGKLRFFDVQYFLEDDTIEILEEIENNSKMHGITHKRFVKRQRLPAEGPWCMPLGHGHKQEVLNVISNDSKSMYYKMDNRVVDERGVSPQYYYRTDLYIGAKLNVYNRVIVLVSCDEFTKQFYRTVYGLKNFEPFVTPKTVKEIEQDILNDNEVEKIRKSYDEVTRKSLIKYGGLGRVFRFIVKMVTDNPINQKRNFMFKYYLDDTNVAIYEFTETNSGIRGGMFRSKCKCDKNKHGEDTIVFHRLVIGAEVSIDDFKFVIVDVDDSTLKFMMDNPTEFPHSDLAAAADRAHRSIDCRFGGPAAYWTTRFGDRPLVDSDEFRRALCADAALDEHAAAVLALAHKRPGPFEPHTELEFRSAVQDTLRKAQFVHFDGLRSNFASRKWIVDRGATAGRLNRVQSAKAVKSSRLPLSVEIVRMLFDKFADDEHDGAIKFEDMIDFMDYIKEPVELPTGLNRELLFMKPKKVLVRVDEFIGSLRADA